MKIIQVDGLQRENVADILVAESLSQDDGEVELERLIGNHGNDFVWFRLVPDDYRLGRGMEDLV